jgi:adenine-specific DNA-methyltransferase
MKNIDLSDNEKRDAIKFIEAGKPLPDKYRFLLFGDDREVELIWNGKTSEIENSVLPFQTIEHIDEPRIEVKKEMQESLFDTSGRQVRGWTNKLIWGDNKLVLSSLKNGPLRKEIEEQGGLKLIYIDPPFDVGADFSMKVEIGDEELTKNPSVIEEVAYRDTWGKGTDSFISMIYERLHLMHQLLADDGCIYVHCDYRVSSYIKNILDEIFGISNYRNEIIWKRSTAHNDSGGYGNLHDTIYFYSKSQDYTFNVQYDPYSKEYIETYFRHKDNKGKFLDRDLSSKGLQGGGYTYEWKGKPGPWRCPKTTMEKYEKEDRIYYTSNGTPRYKQYLDEMEGVPAQDIWTNIYAVNSQAKERINYPTQKPEALVERIIKTSTNPGDLVADFFVGSGTTASVAEKLGRKWICSDLGRFGVHTTRKRMINVQRELKKDGRDFRAFEILNLGKYERDAFVRVDGDLKKEERNRLEAQKGRDFVKLILQAYKAEGLDSFEHFVGKKRDRVVAVGPLTDPVSMQFILDACHEAKEKGLTKIDILGFEFGMGIDKDVLANENTCRGIDINLKIIPGEVFDKRAIERGHVKFYDLAYVDFKPHVSGRGNARELKVELTDFAVFYNQDDIDAVGEKLKAGGSKVVLDGGQVIKLTKEKDSEVINREVLTKEWTDWIDYWSVDFDFESKKEIVRVEENGEEVEKWTGNYIFENEWQSFRTKKDRSLELTSAVVPVGKGERRKIAVKVIDIFGNDTTKVIEINV